jgi:hypothetical protein
LHGIGEQAIETLPLVLRTNGEMKKAGAHTGLIHD